MFDKKDGGIPLRIILVTLTLILVGVTVYVLLENQRKKNKINHRKAIELSDYGFQQIMGQIQEKMKSNPTQIESISKTEYNGGWYKVTVSTSQNDSVIAMTIKSVGNFASRKVVQEKEISLVRSVIEKDTVWLPKLE